MLLQVFRVFLVQVGCGEQSSTGASLFLFAVARGAASVSCSSRRAALSELLVLFLVLF